MTVDIEKLEALASAVIAVNELEEVDADEYDQANVQFDELVTPAAMLDLIAEVKQYKAECEALRKDAERYRWLIKNAEEIYFCGCNLYLDPYYEGDDAIKIGADKDVDAAMSKQANQ